VTRRAFDLSLYLVTDPELVARRDLVEVARAAVAGGATMVQLRDKNAGDVELVVLARALRAALPRTVKLIVNDRIAVALAAGADGVHVGWTDAPAPAARAALGPDAIIGLSASNEEEVAGIDPALIDYVGLGPFAATATKPDAGPPLGATRFAELRRRIALPTVAIAGIGTANAAAAIAAGADGVAVVSAICAANDPEAAARALRRVVDAAKARR
jgi:thiamine-phosphate pyrophosphorylase